MTGDSFDRRRFVHSMAIGSLGLIFLNPVSSLANVIEQLINVQKSDLLFYMDSKGQKRPVTNLAEWEIKRQQIIEGMQRAMGRLPDFSNLPDMDIQIIDELKEEAYTRQSIRFTVAQNEKIP